MRIYSREELHREIRLIGQGFYEKTPAEIIESQLYRLLPKEPMTTLEWSTKNRVIRKPDGTKTNWSRELTPYLVPIMDAHDKPEVLEIVVPKPGRCGGTVVAENHALKRLDNGPSGDIMWYLAGPEEVRSYADRILKPMFEDHDGVSSRIGHGKSDNNKTRKRVGGQTFELMVMSSKTTTNRQGAYIVFDEPDSYHKDFRSNYLEQGRQRQRMLGNDRLIYACAHPDIGWSGGIAAGWVLSTQGIFVWSCTECQGWGSPYPTKFWPDIKQFRLWYQESPEGTPIDMRLNTAAQTAGIMCPHCGALLDEEQRVQMVEGGSYIHKGQSLDVKSGIVGEPNTSETWGFWIHVLMARQVGLSELAKELEGALEHKQRTGKSDKLKQVMVRTFGEVFEGSGNSKGLDARSLKHRTETLSSAPQSPYEEPFELGKVPAWVRYITVAIDVGGAKFDVLARGWDTERRSCVIDRRTIRQRLHKDGTWREIAPGKVQADWSVLKDEIDRIYPFAADPDSGLPVAVMTVDASDGNVTWNAYEFARQMDNKRWGAWRKVRCIKGSTSKKAEPLPPTPTKISKDNEGAPVEPIVTLHVIGAHRLKESVLDDLAIEDHSPGQVYFAVDMPERAYQEIFNEPLVDGDFVRNGPNETLDLLAYCEVGRLMLQPDRESIDWDNEKRSPPWARAVSLAADDDDGEGDEDPAPRESTKAKKPEKMILRGFERLNRAT